MDINLLISIVLALISFGIGSSLRLIDFAKIIRYPRSLSLGLIMQMFFLPILAFAILSYSDIRPEYKMGIMILSLCPGGTTSNFISYLFKLDTALSVLLTSINTFLILITIPIGMEFCSEYFLHENQHISMPISVIVGQIFSIVLIPAAFGVALNHYFPRKTEKLQQPLKIINLILLFTVFAVKFFGSKNIGGTEISIADIKQILPLTLIIYLIAMFSSYYFSRKIIKHKLISITIAVEVGLQNTTLALLVSSYFSSSDISKPALVFAMFSFFTTAAFAFFAKKYSSDIKSN